MPQASILITIVCISYMAERGKQLYAQLQDSRKCGRATIVQTSWAVLRFVAFLLQPCNKTQVPCTVIAWHSCGICGRNAWVRALALVERTPCVSCISLAAVLWQLCVLIRSQENRKENDMLKMWFLSLRQPCNPKFRKAAGPYLLDQHFRWNKHQNVVSWFLSVWSALSLKQAPKCRERVPICLISTLLPLAPKCRELVPICLISTFVEISTKMSWAGPYLFD